jgi:hypothetical protein
VKPEKKKKFFTTHQGTDVSTATKGITNATTVSKFNVET